MTKTKTEANLRGVFSRNTLIITDTLKENPHRAPLESIEPHLAWEYCGKEIVVGKEFHTVKLNGIPHYFRCPGCKCSHLDRREKPVTRRLKLESQKD
ncbi:MAG: hypothetical protein ACE5OZ_18105 [Candidatus Heimdallarchaeota archaeon]